jgi:hypothetical protein
MPCQASRGLFGVTSSVIVGLDGIALRSYTIPPQRLSTIDLAGVRFAWDVGKTLRDVARGTGRMRLR